ncbi:SpoIIE family protein phosphatase [Geitlerinema sp. PCC 9228]|jgi:sigma-B regulation protein RsbU (phosphoserine phosphatase)|uniref:PP2C family protein-serine/threonine phosphatase n=1 Tax=Geitlerinema sp. PCC 9228 TaxID=111611 RepID=UPI0008F9B591|nr:SpoIIE family protein phosphatase [Geitlerinema sp. PCC 9228]
MNDLEPTTSATHILVIDDDPAIGKLLARSLKKQGYEVSVAEDGDQGIKQAFQIKPALIICDWMMPVMDGLEVCRRVKGNANLSTTFFILLTSRGATEDRVIGLDTGADEFLAKPINLNELKARVRAGLRIHHLSQSLRLSKQQLEAELAEAAEYVRSLLPNPKNKSQVSIDARFIPSRQLGGDCFDFYWLDEDCLVMYLLDMAGHGLGAALPSVSVLNLLRSRSLPNVDFYQPHEVLQALNQVFQMDWQQNRYFTIWYGVYYCSRQELVYSSAGHPPALLVPANASGDLQRLKTTGLPIGMFEEMPYTCASQPIEPNSTLYIFSDGVYEINQPNGDVWGLESFVAAIANHHQPANATSDAPSPPALDHLLEHLRKLGQQDTFEDDVSLLQIQFP